MKRKSMYLLPLFLFALGIAVEAGTDRVPGKQLVFTSETHAPRPGDSFVKEKIAWQEAGKPGSNTVWDFSQSVKTGEQSPVGYFTTGADNITSGENATYFRYRFSGDSLSLTGYENASMLVKYQEPALMLKFPLTYDAHTSGSYYGQGKYCDRLDYLFSGSIRTKVDGQGTLILPGGDTLSRVLRVHIREEKIERYQPITPGFDLTSGFTIESVSDSLVKTLRESGYTEVDRYWWYVEGSRYPVFETVEIRKINDQNASTGAHTEKVLARTACLFDPEKQKEQLAEDLINQTVQQGQQLLRADRPTGVAEIKAQPTVGIYPNPVVDNLQVTVQLHGKQYVQVFLYDLQGRMVYKGDLKQAEGYFTETVGMGHWPQGNYVLRVQAGEKSEKKVIVKQ